MKKLITILFVILIIACKKQTTTPIDTTVHEKHGLVTVTINSNFSYPCVDIYKMNCFMNPDGSGKNVSTSLAFWNNMPNQYNNPVAINYVINSKDTGSYFIHSFVHKFPSDTTLYMLDTKKVWLSIKAIDQYGKILMDSISNVNTDITCTFKVR